MRLTHALIMRARMACQIPPYPFSDSSAQSLLQRQEVSVGEGSTGLTIRE